jgi:hypothetical protein
MKKQEIRIPSPKRGLTNVYVARFMKKNTKCTMFRGVYSANKIPPALVGEKQFSIIVNLSESAHKGTHFVCLIKCKNDSDCCMYLDPLALNFTLAEYIPKFISTLKCRALTTLREAIQAPRSHYCGYFCIFLCMLFDARTASESVGQLESFSSKDLFRNDAICMRNIQKLQYVCVSLVVVVVVAVKPLESEGKRMTSKTGEEVAVARARTHVRKLYTFHCVLLLPAAGRGRRRRRYSPT